MSVLPSGNVSWPWFYPVSRQTAGRRFVHPQEKGKYKQNIFRTYVDKHKKIYQQMQNLKNNGYAGINPGTCVQYFLGDNTLSRYVSPKITMTLTFRLVHHT